MINHSALQSPWFNCIVTMHSFLKVKDHTVEHTTEQIPHHILEPDPRKLEIKINSIPFVNRAAPLKYLISRQVISF